jgi:2-polyprenyl-3-methyl-5-hydroxy-6-metoxy-1,4-benzoquinol methylase
MSESIPLCPITGLPASRRIQAVSADLLTALWRHTFRVDATSSLHGIRRFTLWESPCGLAFFDPMRAGDGSFYAGLYNGMRFHEDMARQHAAREDFAYAASFIAPGQRVLDVGCGTGAFSRSIPQASYQGIDAHADRYATDAGILPQTVEQHAAQNPASCDVVCSFHVIEHVTDPLTMAAAMVRCLRPGGLLILAAPLWPSSLTEIPNFVLNAPPNHLTWWNPGAFAALAQTFALQIVSNGTVQASAPHSLIHWIARLSPIKTSDRYYRHAWPWHLSLLTGYALAVVARRFAILPRTTTPIDAVLVARKPVD